MIIRLEGAPCFYATNWSSDTTTISTFDRRIGLRGRLFTSLTTNPKRLVYYVLRVSYYGIIDVEGERTSKCCVIFCPMFPECLAETTLTERKARCFP